MSIPGKAATCGRRTERTNVRACRNRIARLQLLDVRARGNLHDRDAKISPSMLEAELRCREIDTRLTDCARNPTGKAGTDEQSPEPLGFSFPRTRRDLRRVLPIPLVVVAGIHLSETKEAPAPTAVSATIIPNAEAGVRLLRLEIP